MFVQNLTGYAEQTENEKVNYILSHGLISAVLIGTCFSRTHCTIVHTAPHTALMTLYISASVNQQNERNIFNIQLNCCVLFLCFEFSASCIPIFLLLPTASIVSTSHLPQPTGYCTKKCFLAVTVNANRTKATIFKA